MKKIEKEIETFYPASRQAWRKWLHDNHLSKQAVWLLQYKKKSKQPSISWSEAVDEALCFGWIDSVRKTIDDEKFVQFFSKRKPKGTWSKVNKEKVKQFIEEGLMMPAGLESIATAKANGSWTILDSVDALIIPEDLALAFERFGGAQDYFMSVSISARKAMLQWLVLAKRPETRQKRIDEIALLASQNQKPKQF